LDCLHWLLTTTALKDWISDASPSGMLSHLPIHTIKRLNNKIFNGKQIITSSYRKISTIASKEI
jgi:hypothetical protein